MKSENEVKVRGLVRVSSVTFVTEGHALPQGMWLRGSWGSDTTPGGYRASGLVLRVRPLQLPSLVRAVRVCPGEASGSRPRVR